MTRPVHFEVEVLYGTLSQPLCENNAGRDAIADMERDVEMSPRDEEVTCRKCLKALGYETAEQFVDVEHLAPGRIAA